MVGEKFFEVKIKKSCSELNDICLVENKTKHRYDRIFDKLVEFLDIADEMPFYSNEDKATDIFILLTTESDE